MKKFTVLTAALAVMFAGCAAPQEAAEEPQEVTMTGTQKVYVTGEDWGPAVSKTIITFDKTVDAASLSADSFAVKEEREYYVDFETFATGVVEFDRTVTDVYTSDASGNKTGSDSATVTIEMAISPNEGSPFIYKLENGRNTWSDPYNLTVSLTDTAALTSEGNPVTAIEVSSSSDVAGSQKISGALNGWNLDGKFTASDGQEYCYAEFVPEGNADTLVIWLHGGGECGSDPQITILANKVTALGSEEFQSCFNGGAYVLAPQAPAGHHWCNGSEGEVIEGVETYGNGTSMFRDSLFELIDSYVRNNSAINPEKILIGGCSAGGYMTMAQIFEHPDYFAAAFPISEAYYSTYVTDEMINAVKDVPIWFTNAKNDSINPDLATNPLIERIVKAGNTDVHHSEFEDVHDTSGLYKNEDGSAYQYNGHWSWIYFDNNECTEGDLNEWEWLASKVN